MVGYYYRRHARGLRVHRLRIKVMISRFGTAYCMKLEPIFAIINIANRKENSLIMKFTSKLY